jgi:hypothetical protein
MLEILSVLVVGLILINSSWIITSSYGLFSARTVTQEEKDIAERDYLSIMSKCNDRLKLRIDSGPTCDAFMDYYNVQCDRTDNLIRYCEIFDVPVADSLLNYQANRIIQQGCISGDKFTNETFVCEEYLGTLGSIAQGYNRILNTHPHLQSNDTTSLFKESIIGQVINNNSFPVGSVGILITVLDSSGNVIETKHGYTQDNYIRPGQESGFSIKLDAPLSDGNAYLLTNMFDKSDILKPPLLKLNISEISTEPAMLTGTVTNLGNHSTDNIEVSGIFYDANHKVVDVGKANVNNQTALFPNEKATFTVSPFNNIFNHNNITSYAVAVQSDDYTMAPP